MRDSLKIGTGRNAEMYNVVVLPSIALGVSKPRLSNYLFYAFQKGFSDLF